MSLSVTHMVMTQTAFALLPLCRHVFPTLFMCYKPLEPYPALGRGDAVNATVTPTLIVGQAF